MTPLDAALAWIRKGFSPVPIPYRSKKPILENWQQLEITVETAPAYFGSPALNIGVLLGDKLGSADVNCDCVEGIAAARELLPETGLVLGRQSKPLSHYLYRSDPPARTQQFLDPIDHATLIELRGLSSAGNVGLQTVVPPDLSSCLVRFHQLSNRERTFVQETFECDEIAQPQSRFRDTALSYMSDDVIAPRQDDPQTRFLDLRAGNHESAVLRGTAPDGLATERARSKERAPAPRIIRKAVIARTSR
jgi:hypothetical protein